MASSAIVVGAGMVGVSVALHLRRRGFDVVLVDRQAPGEGASFGNGGLIQSEAVFPAAFPRDAGDLLRIAGNRAIDVAYHPLALPGLARPLFGYWRNSHPGRYAPLARAHAALIATAQAEHAALASEAGAEALLRPIGYMRLFGQQPVFDAALAQAEQAGREFGVPFSVLDSQQLAAAEPHLLVKRLGAIHWTGTVSVSDPHALVMAYFGLFLRLGGAFATGDAMAAEATATGWRVPTTDGPVEAAQLVVALGAQAGPLSRRLGYAVPLFAKRGYHMHYRLQGNAVLRRPILDTDSRFLLAPMRAGIRLTTGVEFAPPGAPPTPVQLARAEPVARQLLPLADRVDATPWMGMRPCTPDMLPIIGRMPGQQRAWCAFGHAHQGFTLGPTTGRMLAAMMVGEPPFVAAEAYRPERFG